MTAERTDAATESPENHHEKRRRLSRKGMFLGSAVLLTGVLAAVIFGSGWFPSEKKSELTDADIEALRRKEVAGWRRKEAEKNPAVVRAVKSIGAKTVVKQPDPAERDRQIATNMLGQWELFDEGRYRMMLNKDKTGKLIYKPDGFKNKLALGLFRGELKIDLRWSVKDGLVEISSISGKPNFAFTVATKSRGKRKLYRVKDLGPKRLVLFELKNKKTDNWRKLN